MCVAADISLYKLLSFELYIIVPRDIFMRKQTV